MPEGSNLSTSTGSSKVSMMVPLAALKVKFCSTGDRSSSVNSIAIRPGASPLSCSVMKLGVAALSVIR